MMLTLRPSSVVVILMMTWYHLIPTVWLEGLRASFLIPGRLLEGQV